MDEEFFSDHKLCGFTFAVLAVNSTEPNIIERLGVGSRCYISGEGLDVGFTTENGVVLSCVGSNHGPPSDSNGLYQDTEQCPMPKASIPDSGGSMKRKMRRIGLVNGSMSIVHQIHALVIQKCLKIDARVVRVEVGGDFEGEVRVVVLIDVYLPITLWSGWQFSRLQPIAGALFRHLSCDWRERSSMLTLGKYPMNELSVRESVWKVSDCHVLGCKRHFFFTDASNKRLYDLHEIFRSLPSVAKKEKPDSSKIFPQYDCCGSGIWDLSDDILVNILALLSPLDLIRVASTCHHLRSVAASIMPCMKLKLFPHQQTAVEWMLHREQNVEVLPHPLYLPFSTEDGFAFSINTVSGEIVSGTPPAINDFHGGLFCDEPGLGKTITSLSLILKTQGTLAIPPVGVQVIWCTHNGDRKCAYYELSSDYINRSSKLSMKRDLVQKAQSHLNDLDFSTPKRARLTNDLDYSTPKRARLTIGEEISGFDDSCLVDARTSLTSTEFKQEIQVVRSTRNLSRIKKNLVLSFEEAPIHTKNNKVGNQCITNGPGNISRANRAGMSNGLLNNRKEHGNIAAQRECNDTWVQCDACHKWRKLAESSVADGRAVWFCSMNTDPLYQSCSKPEETWDSAHPVTYLPGFYSKGTAGGEDQNILFFTSVLKEHYASINSVTKKALTWLAKLTPEQLSEMEITGLRSPVLSSYVHGRLVFQIFQAFGLMKRVEKGISRWHYPHNLQNLAFDVAALRVSLCEPLDSVRLYLSRATLIVVPSNLVDHWKTQIEKHVRPGQLQVYIWADHKKPSAHCLAWDYDVVITTFSRLSAEWGPKKRSPLMQVHWLRIILDEGHTLGSSVNLTNKLQMAVSLVASNRWILTGTPTPNTPSSQLAHLYPLLKFLREETYGKNQKSWEQAILRPFEAEMEEGRSLLLNLLHKCMISARKIDLQTIPPCIKKIKYLDFAEEHAKSYNELVVTVRRNILMADWNDPSHVESLLNPKQWKFRSNTIRNVRLSCCVSGHIKVAEAGEDIQETMDILVDNGLDPMSQEYVMIKYNLLNGGNCVRCEEWCRLPVITPCRHLLCLDCVALDSERCTHHGCGNRYTMQTPETLSRPENPNPKWPVPKDLIELQPSYKQDDWDPDWQSTSSSKVAYVLKRLKALKGVKYEASCTLAGGNAAHVRELIFPSPSNERDSCNVAEHVGGVDLSRSSVETVEVNPEKVIIFSQFLEHIHVIEQQLTISGLRFAGMYSPMHSSNKMKSLTMFQHDATCMVLLMDGSAALGLDLSFVTHVFLMEPIWDRSVEEQVISRAHRMGAIQPIHVETLVMRGTIEEQMVQFLQDDDECRRFLKQEFGKSDQEGGRARRSLHDFAGNNYLSQLSCVRTIQKM